MEEKLLMSEGGVLAVLVKGKSMVPGAIGIAGSALKVEIHAIVDEAAAQGCLALNAFHGDGRFAIRCKLD